LFFFLFYCTFVIQYNQTGTQTKKMKKHFLLILCLALPIMGAAQNKPYQLKQEVKVQWGFIPYDDDFGTCCNSDGTPYAEYQKAHFYRDDVRSTEAISVSYMHELKKWFALECAFAFDRNYQHTKSVETRNTVSTQRITRFSIIPMARFTYLNKPMVRLYSAGGVFLTFRKENGDYNKGSETDGVVQLTFFGISVGKKFFGSAELGLGPLGIATVGAGYRF
jgi:hypothetical protein